MIQRPDSYTYSTLTPHIIIGVRGGIQGAGQTLPDDLVLCYSCGWMTTTLYHDHIVEIADNYVRDVI